ncbi:MAG: hypothetical protein J5848_06925 [Bacteroidales bacterium]|nr:hypothetical protein [Bacteroidales bacterium]
MKILKRITLLLSASVIMMMFSACGSSMERDAERMAKRAVEFKEVQKRFGDRSNLGGKPMSRQELERYSKDYIEYANKMLEKYSGNREMSEEFKQLVNKKIKELER